MLFTLTYSFTVLHVVIMAILRGGMAECFSVQHVTTRTGDLKAGAKREARRLMGSLGHWQVPCGQ